MEYLSVKEIAEKWQLSDRMVRKYCADGKIEGAFLTGNTWNIPATAVKPIKLKRTQNHLLDILREEKVNNLKGGLYHKTQVELAYNSNHIEGSTLTEEQTRFIFETNTLGVEGETLKVDDIIETVNHFKCFDYILDNAKKILNEKLIKTLHYVLKVGTSDSKKDWFQVGGYKKLANEVGGKMTTLSKNVGADMKKLIEEYNKIELKTLEDIVNFHVQFEEIHPFQDGNGRVGRLIMFKECLKWGIVPFIISSELKWVYYRGLNEWHKDRTFLMETILSAQDKFRGYLNYFIN